MNQLTDDIELITDVELVERAKNDDEAAKEELFKRCEQVISYNVVKYKSLHWGRLQKSDVEDLISECHIAVMESIRLYKPDRGSSFSNFSKFVIRTRLLRFLEKKSELEKDQVDNVILEKIIAPDDYTRDLTIKVTNERDRKIINLFLDGMRQTDIADEFKITRARVNQIIKECIK